MNSSKPEINCYQGGYFIYQNEHSEKEYHQQDDIRITLKEAASIKESIISLIRQSTSSIKLCSFILSDPEIYHELNEVLSKREVAVFILTQLDDRKMSTSFLSEEEISENFNQNHIDYISKLYTNGAHLRAAKSAHAKFIISDNEVALLMSANITTPSLNENPESGVILANKQALDSLVKLFDIIFQYGTEYTKFKAASKDKQFVVSRDSVLKPEWLEGISNSNLKFTWGEMNQSLYSELIDLIKNSNTSGRVLISTYSVVGLENIPEFVQTIRAYIEQGGSVILFCRGMNYRADHLKNCTVLSEIGVDIYGDLFNHSKGLISDDSGFIFTANIDGNHGLINGFEVGCLLEPNQRQALESFILWQIDNAPYKFQLNPVKTDFYNTYSFYAKSKGINPLEIPDDIVFDVFNDKTASEIENYPTYVLFNSSKQLKYINVSNSFYSANMEGNTIELIDQTNKIYGMETYLLQSRNITINTKNKIVE